MGTLILASCSTSAKAASINELAPEANTAVAAYPYPNSDAHTDPYRNSNTHSHAYIDRGPSLFVCM